MRDAPIDIKTIEAQQGIRSSKLASHLVGIAETCRLVVVIDDV